MKTNIDLRKITRDEFCNLKPGNIVYLKICDHAYQSTITSEPFFNSDADDPDWEVETTNGFSDMYSIYMVN
jgi:hypothetical protein